MKKRLIILEKSQLAANLYGAEVSDLFYADVAVCPEDIDVFLREKPYFAIIFGDPMPEKKVLEGLLARNPVLLGLRLIHIGEDPMRSPTGFEFVRRPLARGDLLKGLGTPLPRPKKATMAADAGRFVNKRVFGRRPLASEVLFNDESGRPIFKLAGHDISLGGMFVDGGPGLKRGTLIFLSFELKGEEVFATAEVARTSDEGMGVKFLGLTREAEELIASYCS